MSEFISYFGIDLTEELEDEIESRIVDEDYISENYEDIIKKCIKVKSTVSGLEFDMLTQLAELEVIQGFTSGVPMSDFLIELGRSEEYIEHELRHLISTLNYIETDENQLYLHGHAINLKTLIDIIVNELIEAEEDPGDAYQLFLGLLH